MRFVTVPARAYLFITVVQSVCGISGYTRYHNQLRVVVVWKLQLDDDGCLMIMD